MLKTRGVWLVTVLKLTAPGRYMRTLTPLGTKDILEVGKRISATWIKPEKRILFRADYSSTWMGPNGVGVWLRNAA